MVLVFDHPLDLFTLVQFQLLSPRGRTDQVELTSVILSLEGGGESAWAARRQWTNALPDSVKELIEKRFRIGGDANNRKKPPQQPKRPTLLRRHAPASAGN